jgi:hypothetical protein
MSNEENELDFEVNLNPDFESMGYELAGSIEFYENPESGEGAYRALLFSTTLENELEKEEDYTLGQTLVMVTQSMLEEYLTREVH